jgi:protein O-mannosyl-transferase
MPDQPKLERAALGYALLALITLAVYLPVLEAAFVTFDDTYYVTGNPVVQSGLTWEGFRWAFTRFHAANWHPLSWLSHMLDCQLYALEPAGHHLTNLLFHTANTLLLFGVLRYLTGAFWRSAFVAALFALHPLHVESVAWVAERKDVLSTFFFILTLWAYARYARQSAARCFSFYCLSLVCFACGLMSKPMLVTVPFVLLLLDFWPLRRLEAQTQASTIKTLVPLMGEKLPFLLLSAASCFVTVIAQHKGGALASLDGGSAVSVTSRLINTPISYAWYLAKLIWPTNLTVIYPYVREWPPETVLLSTALVVALTGAALWQARRRPYVFTGWFWYVGTLVPVIGVVKVGAQSIADRYMYIPSIGLLILLAWGVADLTKGWTHRTMPLALGAAVVLGACALATGAQLLYWQNTETLFRRALAVSQNNYIACNNLGYYFALQGEQELAKKYYRYAIEAAPDYTAARNNLAATLIAQKRYDDAIATLEEALRINPDSADIQSNLGAALFSTGRLEEAIAHLRRAIQTHPEHSLAHLNLGNALSAKHQASDAAAEFRLAAKLDPYRVEAHSNLAQALATEGKLEEAEAEFGRALALQPGLLPAHYGLGEVQMQQGKLDEAITHFSEVVRLEPKDQPSWMQLGVARTRQGKPHQAAEAFSAALRLKPDDAQAHCHVAAALAADHKAPDAVLHYRQALKLQPDLPEALNNLAWLLAANPDPQLRNGREAVDLAERACKLTDYKQPLIIGTLAAAYAEVGRFAEAVATAERARSAAEQSNEPALAARNRELLELYRSGQPARDTP